MLAKQKPYSSTRTYRVWNDQFSLKSMYKI